VFAHRSPIRQTAPHDELNGTAHPFILTVTVSFNL
jgi:hypothetical protein